MKAFNQLLSALPADKRQVMSDLIDDEVVANVAKVNPEVGQYLSQYAAKDYTVQGFERPKPIKKRGMMSR